MTVPVKQTTVCMNCGTALTVPSFFKCQECHQLTDPVVVDLPNAPDGELGTVDVKSACCSADVDFQARATCSDACHEAFVRRCEGDFGQFKKVTDAATGLSHAVPTRIIIEKGLKQQDLCRFPVWNESVNR